MQKKISYLTIIFVVLAAILFAKMYLPTLVPKALPYISQIKKFNKQNVETVTISKGSEKVTLKKESGNWTSDKKKADKTKVETLISTIFTETEPDLVSETTSRHKDLELTKELATEVKLNDNLNLLLGKAGTPKGIYIRFANSNVVYLLSSLSAGDFSATSTFWLDKTIVTVNREKDRKLTLEENGTTTVLINKDKKWIDEESGKEPTKEKLDSLFAALSPLTMAEFATKDKVANYPETPEITLTIEQEKTKDSLEFYKGESNYLVKRVSDSELFIVSSISSISDFIQE